MINECVCLKNQQNIYDYEYRIFITTLNIVEGVLVCVSWFC